jgi:uncharacterized protein YdaL
MRNIKLLFPLFGVLLAFCGDALGEARPTADVLIIHDSLHGQIPNGIVVGNTILDLLGHFGLKGKLIPLEEYRAGELSHHRFVFVLGVDDRKITYPRHLLADIRSTSLPVFWISGHLNELLAASDFQNKIGFALSSAAALNGFNNVIYKDQSLPKKNPLLFPVNIQDRSKVQVFATAMNEAGLSKPYIIRSGSFWYCADSPFSYNIESDRFLAFCDLLHDFFKMPHQEERRALIRLEDISIESDTDELRDIADYLYERHIPFQISLIPIFRDPDENSEIYLSDRPAFVRAVKYMVSKGGLVVLHGVYHQYQKKSGDDYEFWDSLNNKPIQGDSPQLVEQRLRIGLEECFKNGIYPITWETPHYGASEVDYATIARYFSTSYERMFAINNSETGSYFPYPTIDRFDRFIIPENLGYIDKESPDPDGLVKNAERMRVVRDGVASFFFHPWMDRKYLVKVLDGIEACGYHFRDIGEYDCRVQMDERLVQTFTESVQLSLNDHYLHRFLLSADGKISGESWSQKPINGIVRNSGIVPSDGILVMEGVEQVLQQKEPATPSWWQAMWDNAKNWMKSKFQQDIPGGSGLMQPQVLVIWDDTAPRADRNNLQSYISAFSAFGFRTTKKNWRDFNKAALDINTILVVPRWPAGKISSKQIGWIEEWVHGGGRLILDGPGSLSQAVGVRSEKRILRIKQMQDEHFNSRDNPTEECTWNPPAEVTRFSVSGPISVYARDKDSEMPLAILAQYGQGRFIYLGERLDPSTPLGYTRYPYFVHYVRDGFGVRLPLQRAQIELYFDPGVSKSKNLEGLVLQWHKLGVRAIFAAAYQFWPAWSYNYEYLIDLCHKNGILVYAWFELPHVSPKFWEDHREWRAKTATGADAGNNKSVWRYHMDLDIPECQEMAFDFVEGLLKQYAWDGVNVAELNYDTNDGPNNPQDYIPMGSSTRTAFRALGGFDPIELFKPDSPNYWKKNTNALKKFEQYRTQRVLAWHRALLERITPIAQERDMEIIVTMLDSLHSSKTTRDTGVDSQLILSLMDHYPFTLQVEDPFYFWTERPDRYKRFGETYLKLVRDPKRLMFDINVTNDRDISHSYSPTVTPSGLELEQCLVFATMASGRAAIYGEGTIPFEDLQVLSRVLAHDSRLENRWNSWITTSNHSILMSAPGQWENFRVDDKIWPGWGEGEVSLPVGEHRITTTTKKWFKLFDTTALDLRLLWFTANLDSLAPTKRGLEFVYNSSTRTYALFNRLPFEIRVDGQSLKETLQASTGICNVRLPSGHHKVEVVADSAASVILDTTSLFSSHFIFIFASVACGLMLLLYTAILGRRAIARAVKGKSIEAGSNRR